MSFNPHYPILFLLLFSLLCNANAIPIDDKQNGQKKRHIGHNDVEILIMYGLDLVILQLGILCTLYMIIRTFIRWYKHDLSLHMSHKLPFYMALSDFFIYVALTVNLYYPAITGHQWPGQSCKIVALGFYYSALFNMILVGSLALVSYFRVCKAMIINTGILDYKLFIFPIFIPAILSIPAWQYFGPNDGYWCLRSRKSSIIPLVLLYVEIFILLTSLFCYIGISHAINVSRFRNDEENFRTSNRKIVSYIFMYILQWTPVMIFIIIGMEHPANMWVFAVCIISLPAGGILNTYRYVSNEGFWNIGSEDKNGQDPSLRNRTNLHSIKNFGGPPTVSQWRELSGEDVEDQRSSDQSQDQIQLQNVQNESQDQIQIQLQNVQNESQDQIQIQLQNVQNESQDQIQIQLQSESQGQNIQSQDDKIQP